MTLTELIRERKMTSAARWGAPENPQFAGADPWTVTLRYQRVFTNNSGSAVLVREAGFLRGARHLLIRDLVGGAGVRVGTLASLTVSYDMRTVR